MAGDTGGGGPSENGGAGGGAGGKKKAKKEAVAEDLRLERLLRCGAYEVCLAWFRKNVVSSLLPRIACLGMLLTLLFLVSDNIC